MTGILAASAASLLLLGGPLTDLLPSPSPLAQPNVLPSPVPLPSIPGVLPASPSPSPSPSPSQSPAGTGGQGGQTGGQFGSSGFSASGIAGAFGASNVDAATTTPAGVPTPVPYQPVAPAPSLFTPSYIFPTNDKGAAQSAVLPLLAGLLLVSLGLWLMAMRHRREALLAASLERTKTDFLNLASHELRGPLTILKGYIATAREGDYGPLPKEFAGRLPIVQTQLSRMEMLVEQMLETARLEVGNPDLRREPTDLRRVLQNALPAEILAGSDHQVDVEAPTEPVLANVDEHRIEQVLHNLIENAIKYSDPPARVTVRLSVAGDAARFDVTDRGHGIAPEDMEKLFSRFGRLVTEENSHIPGVGLGLFLGRSVARMHGGDLTATSTAGEGSTFTLTLPLPAEGDEPAPQPVPAPLPQRALRWLARLLPNRARESVS